MSQIIGTAQFTIIDFNDINISMTEPENPVVDQLWLDTSQVPNILKRWNGTEWVRANYENLQELDPEAYDTLNNVNDEINNPENGILTRLYSAETKIRPENIYLSVKEVVEEDGQKRDEFFSFINMTSQNILIQSDKISLNGSVTLTSLLDPESKTVIDGAKIKTGSIDASKINVDSLSAAIINAANIYVDKLFSNYLNTIKITADTGSFKTINVGKLNGQEVNLSAGSFEYDLDSKGNRIKDASGNDTLVIAEYRRNSNNLIIFKDQYNQTVNYIEIQSINGLYTVNHPIAGLKSAATIELLQQSLGWGIFEGKDGKFYVLSKEGYPDVVSISDRPHLTINSKGLEINTGANKLILLDKDGLKISNSVDAEGRPIFQTAIDAFGIKANAITTGTLYADDVTIKTKAGYATEYVMELNKDGLFIFGGSSNNRAIKLDKGGLFYTENYKTANPTYKPIISIIPTEVEGQSRTGLIVTDADIVSLNAGKITTGTLNANNVTISGGDVTINSNGLTISGNKSSINLNNKFIVTSDGILTAKEGYIANWQIQNSRLYSESENGYIEINSNNKNIILGEKETSYATPGNPQYVYINRIILGNKDGEQVLFGQSGVGINDKRINLLFNREGFKIYNDNEDLFKIDIFGNANFAGTINAKGGYFSGIVTVGQSSTLKIDGVNKKITVNDTDVVISENGITINKGSLNINNNFIVDLSGSLTAKTGYIGNSTNGVKINSDGLEIIGTGVIKNQNTTIKQDSIEIKDGSSNISVVLGKIGTNEYGLIGYKGSDVIFKLDRNIPELAGWNIDKDKLSKGDIEISSALSQFIVKDSGKKVITIGKDNNASFNLYDSNENKILYLDKTGLHTTSGTLHINADGAISLTGSITASSGSIGGITISSNELSTGSLHITNQETIWIGPSALDKKIIFGQYETGKYGLKINGTKTIELNQNGITSENFSISTATGNVTAKNISLDSGTFSGNITLSGNINMPNITLGSNTITIKDDSSNEIIKLGKFTKDSETFTGIYIKSGEIDLTNFKVDSQGNITATSGTIGGVSISNSKLTAGKVELSSSGLVGKDNSNNVIFSINDTGLYLKGSVDAISGTIGGVTISNNKLIAGNVEISSSGIIAKDSQSNTIFEINSSGATFKGSVVASSGYFGSTSSQGVKISSNGLEVNEESKIVVKNNSGSVIATLDKFGITMSQGEIKLGWDGSKYKFYANQDGIISNSGLIAGWTISENAISKGNITLDSSNENININNNLIIGKYTVNSSTYYGLKLVSGNETIYLDSRGLNSTNFSIDNSGNVSLKGNIEALSGKITGKLFVGNTNESTNNRVEIDGQNGSISVINHYVDGDNKIILNTNGINVYNKSDSVNPKLTISVDGKITAKDADITGSIKSNSGYFGTQSNGVVIGASGLTVVGNGSIIAGDTTISSSGITINGSNSSINLNNKFVVTSSGSLTAVEGLIGGWNITSATLEKTYTSGNFSSQFKLTSSDKPTLSITNTNSTTKEFELKVGKISDTEDGLYIETNNLTSNKLYFKFSKNGLNISNQEGTIFSVAQSGNATFTGIINALGGAFKNSVTVGDNGKIVIDGSNKKITVDTDKVIINESGIQINSGSINIGTKFSVDNQGNLVASNVAIEGIVNATAGFFGSDASKISISQDGIVIGTSGKISIGNSTYIVKDVLSINNGDVLIGKNGTEYGIFANSGKVKITKDGLYINDLSSSINLGNGNFVVTGSGDLTAKSGSIAGWNISSSTISKTNVDKTITLDSSNAQIVAEKTNSSKIIIGSNGTSYGVFVESSLGSDSKKTITKINENGFSIEHDTATIFAVDKDGKAKILKSFSVGSSENIKLDGEGEKITVNNTDVVISTSGIVINKGSININNKFTVTNTGDLTATSATITGTINGLAGYFGDSTNGVKINSDGLEVTGTGKIKLSNSTIEKDVITIKDNSNSVQLKIGNYGSGYGLLAGDAILNSTGLTINGTGSSIKLGNGNFEVTGQGNLTAKSGSIAGWTFNDSELSKELNNIYIKLDSANGVIKSGVKVDTTYNDKIIFGSIASGEYGLIVKTENHTDNYPTEFKFDKTGFTIKHNTDTLFSVDKIGNAAFKGNITATGGSFTGSVSVGSGGKIVIDGPNKRITVDTDKVVINETGINIKSGSINIGNNAFVVDSSGNLTATSATITGTVNGTSGYFGNATNGVAITSSGLEIKGTGEIKLGYTKILSNKISINSDSVILGEYASGQYGIRAGDATLDSNGLTINGNKSSINLNNNFIVTSSGQLTAKLGSIAGWSITDSEIFKDNGTKTLSIDSANQVIRFKESSIDKFKLGLYDGSNYGFYLITDKDASNKTTTFTIDKLGFKAKYDTDTLFSINNDGSATFKGIIYATGGYFASSVSVGLNGKIVIDGQNKQIAVDTDKVVISETGIAIKSGSIDIGDGKFKVLSDGTLTATGATISGTINSQSGYFGSSTNGVLITTTGLEVKGTGIIKLGNTEIQSNKISVNSGDVILGEYSTGVYGLKAGDATLTKDGLKIDGTSSSIKLGNGNFEVTGSGVLTAKSGSIAGWNISTSAISKTISSDSITLDATNLKLEAATTSAKTIIGKYDGTNIGLYAEAKDTDNHYTKFIFDASGLVVKHETDELFKIDKSGNASFKGVINATGGNFTGQVKVGDNTSSVVIDGINKKITVNSTDVVIDSNGITIGKGSININSGQFSVTSAGVLTAQNATITGTVNANAGYFGGSDKITINSNGIVVNNGQITLNNTIITKDKISINNDKVIIGLYDTGKYGIKAGDAILTENGLIIDGNLSSINLGSGNFVVNGQGELISKKGLIANWIIGNNTISQEDNEKYAIIDSENKTIKLGLNKYQTVSPGNVIKQSVDKIILGRINDSEYGLYIESDPTENEYTTKLKFSASGLSIINNETPIFTVNNNGDAYFAGQIKATGGYFAKAVNVGLSGAIKIDGQNEKITVNNTDVVIDANGIAINKGSISIGTSFSVSNIGILTASGATITGTINATGGYFGNQTNGVSIESTGLKINGSGSIVLDKTSILSDRIEVKDASNNVQVTLGKSGTEYGLFAGSVKLTSQGLQSTGITIGSSGINITGNLSINLNSKFIVASDGTVTATQGTIGGWTLSSTKLSATGNGTTIDLSNQGYIDISKTNAGHIKLGYLTSTVGLLIESANGSDSKKTTFTFDDNGLLIKHDTATIMSIDKNGDASFAGIITAKGGSFTGTVNVGSGSVIIDGSNDGSIRLSNNNVVLSSSGIYINSGSININNKFTVTDQGTLTAQDATITGTVNATSGYFGSSQNKITIDSQGLIIGTGRIVDNNSNPSVKLDSQGLVAKKGSIGKTVIDEFGIKAGGTKVTDTGIKVTGQQSVVIDDGSMIVKDKAGYNVVNVGNNNGSYGITIYGAENKQQTTGVKSANQTADGYVFTYSVQTPQQDRNKLRRVRVLIAV